MESKAEVSIIIVNYNTKKLTYETVQSVVDFTKDVKYEIVLIDNNSTDNSLEYFNEKIKYKNIKILESSKNLGFGKANNLAFKYCTGKYIFLLNSDTLLRDNAIKKMYDYMENNLDVGICGGNLYNGNNEPIHSFGKNLPSIWNEIPIKAMIKKFFVKKRYDFNYSSTVIDVGYITGADLFIRKEIFFILNGFDPDFFMYFEETELCARARKMGRIVNLPFVKIIHLVGGSIDVKERKIKMFIESKYKYYQKVYGDKIIPLMYYISQFNNFMNYKLFRKKTFKLFIKINKEEYYDWKNERGKKC